MTEQQTVKVYELAKGLGIDSISLLDKLKALNIQVKNHMSDLRGEEADLARTSLRKPTEGPKRTAAKPRKKVTATVESTDAAPAPSGTSAAPKAAAAKVTRTRKTTAPVAEETPAAKTVAPVIRRRVKADGTTEAVTHAAGSTAPAHLRAPEPPAAFGAAAGTAEEAEIAATEAEMAIARGAIEEEASAIPQAPAGAEARPSTAAKAGAPAVTAAPVTAAPGATSAGPQRPVAPRRSILKIVEPQAPPPRPIIRPAAAPGTTKTVTRPGTTGTTDKDGFRIVKMTKENLDQMAEEEAAKKRGGGRVPEIRPEDVRFADYRKKEMVFLPKRKKLPVGKELKHTQRTTPKAEKRVVEMKETISVQDLASQLSVKAPDLIRKLMQMGTMASINQALDFDTATLVANEYKYEVRNLAFNESTLLAPEDKPENLVHRPPVVTIMGHVDHGKTTLLDSIREANVAAGEAGGITQHIGAYTVHPKGPAGPAITFIDTPGHEAFSVMRARGANVTDIVILVVSADDGVMPQTREALSHAQAAKVPIIVAVNKIDKPGANPEKIKQGLAELNLLAEDWGGETMFIPVSALKKTNIDKLLDAILLQAEVLDLKADPNLHASGVVLEARLEKGRGPVMSVLVKRGTLHVGDPIVSGNFAGKVKAMTDDKGRTLKEAGPGVAVEVLGLEGIASAGEPLNATDSDTDAKAIASNRIDKAREKVAGAQAKMSLEELFSKIKTGDVKELNTIVKADVFGSVEAIKDSLTKLSTDKVAVKVIHAATGGVTESDVLLASASNAIIIGFNVRPETKARQLAESEHVEVKSYAIIYELLDDIKKAMTGLLDKKKVEKFLGRAEVRQIFSVPKIGTIAGSAVIDGKILRGANVRLLRDSRVIYTGKMSSLKRFKDDAKEVAQGFECGIGIENYNDLKPGDVIEAFQIDLVAPTLEEASGT